MARIANAQSLKSASGANSSRFELDRFMNWVAISDRPDVQTYPL